MKHLEERLQTDFNIIKTALKNVASMVEESIKNAVNALITHNEKMACNVILGDGPINRAVREMDQLCHSFIATHLPCASDLRYISSVMRTGIGLERIGDYAVTICRESVQLSQPLSDEVIHELQRLATTSLRMLNLSLHAFHENDSEMAKNTMGMADQVERTFDDVFTNLVVERGQDPQTLKDLFVLFVVFISIERVSDQAKNICENTVFASKGEMKAPKMYRVLFLDEDNVVQSQLAEAIAKKIYSTSGIYSSAGRLPKEDLSPTLLTFMHQHGLGTYIGSPKPINFTLEELSKFHVIVSLSGAVKSYIPQVPFHTVAIEWDVGEIAFSELDELQIQHRLEEMYRNIALHVRDLMTILRGEGAS